MEPLGDVAHVKSCFGPFGDSVSVSARKVHDLHRTCHRLRNHFGRTRWYSEVTRLKWKLVLFRLDMALILTQDRYIVYAKRTICLEIVLEAPDGTPMLCGSCGISFWSA
jgi:hypothetical protein